MTTKLAVKDDSVDIKGLMADIGAKAKAAATVLATTPTAAKNNALKAAAAAVRARSADIMAANELDMADAKARGLSPAMTDRLLLTPERIEGIAAGIEAVAELDDPVGRELATWDRPNGLKISRVAVPLGVIGIIYESRPNVTADAGVLCLKAGNAAILRGGSESAHSSRAIHACLAEGLKAAGLPEAAIQIIPTQDRAAVGELLGMVGTVDIIVPRGGRGLIERVQNEAKMPVMAHLDGICHVYLDKGADPEKARDIAVNAKMRRTGICGAMETLLVDKAVAATILPPVLDALLEKGCEIRGDAAVQALDARVKPATDADWDTEYLDAILSVRTVDGVDGAIAHIAAHGSHHTDSIVTEDKDAADAFTAQVDSAIVMVNASTQFADGGEFGMGAEIGISTGKLHARGPVGVDQLTSYKYVVRGTGQTRP